MTILETLCVSGGDDVIIPTLQLTCEAWENYPGVTGTSLYITHGFEDHYIWIDDAPVLFEATGMAISLPKRDASGAQNLNFVLSNLNAEVEILKRLAIDAGKDIYLIYRTFLLSNLMEPSEEPLHMIVKSISTQNGQAQVTAGLFNLIDVKWPRNIFNSNNAPGMGYM